MTLRFRRSTLALITFTLLALSPSASFSTANKPEFDQAVADFKAGNLEEARKNLLEIEVKYPNDPTLLFNLGLIAQHENRNGAALALWRKALVKNPTDSDLLNAVEWTKSKLTKSEIAHETDIWEEFRRLVVTKVSPIGVTSGAALFLLLAGWRILRWLGIRRRAVESEIAAPGVPFGGFLLLGTFVLFFGLSIAIYTDRFEVRGTILPAKVEVLSAPDVTATPLFELYEGMEVILRDSRKVGDLEWRRITYPGGMTGWIRGSNVFTTADSSARIWEQ